LGEGEGYGDKEGGGEGEERGGKGCMRCGEGRGGRREAGVWGVGMGCGWGRGRDVYGLMLLRLLIFFGWYADYSRSSLFFFFPLFSLLFLPPPATSHPSIPF